MTASRIKEDKDVKDKKVMFPFSFEGGKIPTSNVDKKINGF